MRYKLTDFDYNLPIKLIAQQPIRPRDHSRLLLLDRKNNKIEHKFFYNLIDYLQAGDVLVINNSKVFPARLMGRKEKTKGKIEVFLHQQLDTKLWECLIGGKVKVGLKIAFSQGLKAEIMRDNNNSTWQVKFNYGDNKFWSIINRIGHVPLPPYIKRNKKRESDKKDYQTIFAAANRVGSVAAPTAGLHFSRKLFQEVRNKGVIIIEFTLHVGLGTFAPVKTEDISRHKMHQELVIVSKVSLKKLNEAVKNKNRIIALGTTSCRVLESIDLSRTDSYSFWTDIFVFPGYKFKLVDALITNFHLPKSTLLMLVSALAGKKRIEQAYQVAIKQKYRFFSYGDAMFIY